MRSRSVVHLSDHSSCQEPALVDMKDTDEPEITRGKTSGIITRAEQPTTNVSKKESKGVKNLLSNETVIIADKGSAIVVLNANDYESKTIEECHREEAIRASHARRTRGERRKKELTKTLGPFFKRGG